jgi:hypothetical protein
MTPERWATTDIIFVDSCNWQLCPMAVSNSDEQEGITDGQ